MISDNGLYQQRTKLDIEIDELLVLMNMIAKWKYIKKKKTTNHKVQLIKEYYINKTSGR